MLVGMIMTGTCILAAVSGGSLILHPALSFDRIPVLLFAAVCVFVQACGEEIESRGLLFGKMRNEGVPVITAIIVNRVFFAFVHSGNTGIGLSLYLNIFLIGILLAISVELFHTLWFACAIHMAWNYAQDFLFGLPDSGYPAVISFLNTEVRSEGFFFDSVFGIEGSLTATFVIAAATAALIAVGRKKTGSGFLTHHNEEN